MTDRSILYTIRAALAGGSVAVAEEIALTIDGVTEQNVSDYLETVATNIATLQNTAFNSGRSFARFNDGFTIDRNNIASFEGINNIYTAKNDKPLDSATRPDVNLPNDTEIQASAEVYPIVFEFTHLGGTGSFSDRNLVRFFLDGVLIGSIQRDQATVISKASAGAPYVLQSGLFDPNQVLLPSGVFNLKVDTNIDNIATIATELGAATITAGTAYIVTIGGTWSGLTVPDGSVLVALVNGPSLLDSADNNDWLLLDNPRVNAKSAALLSNIDQDGIVFEANRNFKVDAANVTEFNAVATGVPITRQLLTNSQGSGQSIRFDNVPIQFADLVGGNLEILIRIDTVFSSGFLLAPTSLQLYYSEDIIFTFPLSNVALDNGVNRVRISIPNEDYTAILNSDVSLRFFFDFNGAVYNGNYTISAVVNSSVGNLHNPVIDIAQREAQTVSQVLNARIDEVLGDVDQESASLAAISDRISPYRDEQLIEPDTNAYFLDSTGADGAPTALSQMTRVSPSNPRFEAGDVALYVAVVGGSSLTYILKNITAATSAPLDSVVASIIDGGVSYFIHRVTSVTATDVYEADRVSSIRVVAWQADIDQLESDVQRIDIELEHPALNIPDDVAGILTHDVTVTDDTGASATATDYNRSLSDVGAIAVLLQDPATSAPVAGYTRSNALKDSTTDTRGQKLFVIAENDLSAGVVLRADDGSAGIVDLMSLDAQGNLNIKQFVPAIPAGSTSVTVYPLPSNQVRRDWYTVAGHTGNLQPEADELFFTRDLPAEATFLTYNVRYAANGSTGPTVERIFSIGGASDSSDSFTLSLPSGESFSIETLWRAATRDLVYRATPNANNSGLFIFDTQVNAEYFETRVVPATPATTRDRSVGTLAAGDPLVVASRPSVPRVTGTSNPTLTIVTNFGQVDTGFLFDDLFKTTDDGFLEYNGAAAVYNYRDFLPSQVLLSGVAQRSSLPSNGFYTADHTFETVLDFDVQLKARTSAGDEVILGQGLVVFAPNGTRYMVSADNDGKLVTTLIT